MCLLEGCSERKEGREAGEGRRERGQRGSQRVLTGAGSRGNKGLSDASAGHVGCARKPSKVRWLLLGRRQVTRASPFCRGPDSIYFMCYRPRGLSVTTQLLS